MSDRNLFESLRGGGGGRTNCGRKDRIFQFCNFGQVESVKSSNGKSSGKKRSSHPSNQV